MTFYSNIISVSFLMLVYHLIENIRNKNLHKQRTAIGIFICFNIALHKIKFLEYGMQEVNYAK